ncbi:hypothetical protein Leryth_010376 [Lithospermum erythrorhizon]|nr:hypothetical protein Leryth_010376 [Lithospermum erythrorhizon]
MLNLKSTADNNASSARLQATAEKAMSFITKGWREVRSSADADLQLIKRRANTFRSIADKEVENFLKSASKSQFTTLTASANTTPAEIEFVKKLQPKLNEFRKAYSGMRNPIVAVGEEEWGRVGLREEGVFEDLIKAVKNRFRDLEYKGSGEIFQGLRNSQFVGKVKSSLKSIYKDSSESKDVPPLDVPELLAYLVRQSSPFLDQLGIKRDISDKIVESLCTKRKSQLLLRSGESSAVEADAINDDLDLRIASVLQSTGHCYEGGIWNNSPKQIPDGKRHVAIVTTASLPWMTGTAVNPLFRAAFLAKSEKQDVTLLVPWLCRSDQELVYPNSLTFSSPQEQEQYIRGWLEERVGFKADFKISFYPGKVLRLSAATQDLPKSIVCNVHGVNPKFLRIGEKIAADRECGQQAFSKGAYFLGKMVWAKGYKELIDLLAKQKKDLNDFNLDVFGNGEDAQEVQSLARKLNLNLNFKKGRDHADDSLLGYKVFINPSVSDVLCTATAEALAMGKFVVCADHPSNEFFRAFPNCLTYKTPEEFVTKVKEAMDNEPHPLTPEQQYNLSWEAATQRFMEYSDLDKILNGDKRPNRGSDKSMQKSVSMPDLTGMVEGGLSFAHYCFTGNELLRLCTGGIPGSRNYDMQHSKDLHLLPPQVQNPIYGW